MMKRCVLLCACVWAWGAAEPAGDVVAGGRYAVEATVSLNEASRRHKEVSYKLRAELALRPHYADQSRDEALLHFELRSPVLLGRGARVTADYEPVPSLWDSYPSSEFYAQWQRGRVLAAHLDLSEPPELINFKRALISLFQFQAEGEHKETDISGSCHVSYELLSPNVTRKIKSGCDGEWGGSRRVSRYELSAAGLSRLHAEEVHEVRGAAVGLKARAWLQLHRTRRLQPLPSSPHLPRHLSPTTLDADLPPLTEEPPEELPAEEAAEAWGSEEAGAGGTAGQARAALRARCGEAGALAASSAAAALGACGGGAAHAAARRLLELGGEAAAPLQQRYLHALALAPDVPESVIEDVLKLSAWPSAPERQPVAASALAALAATARALRLRRPAARLPAAARAALLAALAACAAPACRVPHLRALATLADPRAADAALWWAERGTPAEGAAALDVLDALAAGEAGALLAGGRLARLERLAVSGRPLEVRAAAADLLARLQAEAPWGLARAALALAARGDHEVLRVLWQRLAALGETHEHAARLVRALPAAVRARALLAPGSSSVLERAVGGAARAVGARAALQSVQVASGGALRRGLVRLSTRLGDALDDSLTVEVQTSGLQALAGGAGGADDADESVGAALLLGVGGVRLPPVQLFAGQAELLAHVWAGTASAPTPVLRALRPLPARAHRLRLLDGALLWGRSRALVAAAMDAHAQVSLWSRSARAGLEARGAAVWRAALRVATAGGALEAAGELAVEPRLHISADLDFYEGSALCVRAREAAGAAEWEVRLGSRVGARRVRRGLRARLGAPGRTLSLGALNDATCRTLVSAED